MSGNLSATRETRADSASGYAALLVMLLAVVAAVAGVVFLAGDNDSEVIGAVLFPAGVLVFFFTLFGLYWIQPNQAFAILLFGEYRGTDRRHGIHWIWPWFARKKISLRLHNVPSEKLKVNDLRGNPIEIASNVVWRVADTAQALFDVDDYKRFVEIQIESAVRSIGSRYPYDDFDEGAKTLRGDAGHIADELRDELQERVLIGGIAIDECRLTHLAYAPEIAQTMLRRQQAEAVIAARSRLVEGAVGMVEMALGQLSAKGVVDLDDERRAAMVSNLMVVLCGERDVNPVVNAGTLYQ